MMRKIWLSVLLLAVSVTASAEMVVAQGGETIAGIIHGMCGEGADIGKVLTAPRNIRSDEPLEPYTEVRFHCYGYDARTIDGPQKRPPMPVIAQPERDVAIPEAPAKEAVASEWVSPDEPRASSWKRETRSGNFEWNPGSNPYKGDLTDAIEELYGDPMIAGEFARTVREGTSMEAVMDCTGEIVVDGMKLKAVEMAFGKNRVIEAERIVPKACSARNSGYTEKFRVYRTGQSEYLGIPPACGNPTKLVVTQTTPAEPPVPVPAPTPQPITAVASQEACVQRFDGYVGGGLDFAGANGKHGWIGFDGYCRIFVDGDGGKHYLGAGGDFFGGSGSGDWSYEYRGLKFRPVAYYWEDKDGKKTLRLRPLITLQADSGNDGKGYANDRKFAMAGVEVIFDNDDHSPGNMWTGWRISGSFMWVLSKDGSHSWKGVPISGIGSVISSIRNVLQLGGRVYVYDLKGDNGRIFTQAGYREEVGGGSRTIGVSIGYESKDAIVEVWVGPVWNMDDWSRAAFIGAQYNFGKKMLIGWSEQRMACAEEKLGERNNGCAVSKSGAMSSDMTVPLGE